MALQLCADYDGSKGITYPALIEPKLDGVRSYCLDGKFFSRNDKEQYNLEEIGELLKPLGMVFDGEIMAEDWSSTISVVHTKIAGNIGNAVYNIFDMLTPEEWAGKVETPPQIVRSARLKLTLKQFEYKRIKIVPVATVGSNEQVMSYIDMFLKQGFEGAILKDPTAPYMFRRHRSWTKLKPFRTAEFEVVGAVGGTGKYEGMLGALQIRVKDNIICGLGTGFTDEERKEFWINPPRRVEVRFQELTPDGVLRFPSFLRVRNVSV